MTALDRLLAILRPGGPAVATAAFDAELAALGLELDEPAQDAELLRCLAAAGPMLRDVLRATLEHSPKHPVQPRLDRLIARGHVVALGKAYDLAPALRGRFGEFARLPPPAVSPPALDWPGALTALTQSAVCAPDAVPATLGAVLGWPRGAGETSTLQTAALQAAVDRCDADTRVLLTWLAPRLERGPLRLLVEYGLQRVTAASGAALAESPDRVTALEASLFVCLSDFADVLTPAVLNAPGERREELLRRWCWFLGVPIAQETPARSVLRLVSLDYRRIVASLEAAAIEDEVQAIQKKLLDGERARRKAAAEAYSSGRRE